MLRMMIDEVVDPESGSTMEQIVLEGAPRVLERGTPGSGSRGVINESTDPQVLTISPTTEVFSPNEAKREPGADDGRSCSSSWSCRTGPASYGV